MNTFRRTATSELNSCSAHRADSGFTVTEVLAAVAIVGVLSAIAVPVTLSQQAQAADVTTRADLTTAAAAIDSALLTWRGAPVDGTLNICHFDADYPSEVDPTYVCEDGQWMAYTLEQAPTDPPLGGKLSPGVTLTGRISAAGAYCLTAKNTRFGATPFFFDSATSQIAEGTCATANEGQPWVDPAQPGDGDVVVDDPGLPEAPTGLNVSVSGNVATVSWNGEPGVTYAVSVSSQPIKTLTVPAVPAEPSVQTCLFPAAECGSESSGYLPTGSFTATVRAQGETGWGPGATMDFGVTTMPPTNGTPEQITTVFGSDQLFKMLFGANANSAALEDYVTTPEGRQDFERLMFSAPQTVLNSKKAMDIIVGSDTALGIVVLNPPAEGLYTLPSVAMNSILANPAAKAKVINSDSGMAMVANSRAAMTVLANSTDGMAAVIASDVALTEIFNSPTALSRIIATTNAMAAIAGSTDAVTRLTDSPTALTAMLASSSALTALTNSSDAMGVFADSPSAMNAFVTNSNARAAIIASPTAMAIVDSKPVAIGKLTAGAAGLDPSLYNSMADLIVPSAMNAIAASPTARGFVLASPAAMDIVKVSDMAVGKFAAGMVNVDPVLIAGASGLAGSNLTNVFSDNDAWTLLTRSPGGMTGLASSAAAMTTVTENPSMSNDLLETDFTLNRIATSPAARTAFLTGEFTGPTVSTNAKYVAKFLAGTSGLNPGDFANMGELTGSDAWGTVLAQPAALNQLVVNTFAMDRVTGEARDAFNTTPAAVAKLVAAQANLSPNTFDTLEGLLSSSAWANNATQSAQAMAALAQSPTSLATVAQNATAIADLIRSSAAREKILEQPTAVDVLVASANAMNAISSQAAARNEFNSGYALSSIRQEPTGMAIGKFTAGLAGLSPAGYADITAVLANVNAVNAIAVSVPAATALSGSTVGSAAFARSSTALDTITVYDDAIRPFVNSATAMAELTKTSLAINAIHNSTVMLNQVKDSPVAMDAIAASVDSLAVFIPSGAAMPLFAASETAMDSLSASEPAWTRILTTPTALSLVQSNPMAAAKLAAGIALATEGAAAANITKSNADIKSEVSKVVSPGSLTRLNLVENPSLETNVAGWTVGAGGAAPTRAASSSFAWTGSRSLQVQATAAGESTVTYVGSGTHVLVDPLQSYTASAYVRSSAPRNATIAITWRDRNASIISTSTATATALPIGQWSRLTHTAQAPVNAVGAWIRITVDGVQNGESYFVDGVMLEMSNRADPYFDGSSTGGTWDGTTHASTSQWGILNTVLGNANARNVLFNSAGSMTEIAYHTRFVDALRGNATALAAAETASTATTVFSGIARTDARRLADRWATVLNGVTVPAAGLRLRMSLDASLGTGDAGTLYAYQNDTSAASLTNAATGVKPNNVPSATLTRFDLTSPESNVAVSPTNFCLTINYRGQSVSQEYRGSANGTPVDSCAAGRSYVTQSHTTARALSNPTASATTVAGIIGRNAQLNGASTNAVRQEWVMAENSTGTAFTTGNTANTTVVYNSEGTRNTEFRVLGSGGEARVTPTVQHNGFDLDITVRGGKGGTGGNANNNGSAVGGTAGSNGDVSSGRLRITSVPFDLTLAGLGTAGNGGNGSSATGGGLGAGAANGAAGTGYTHTWQTSRQVDNWVWTTTWYLVNSSDAAMCSKYRGTWDTSMQETTRTWTCVRSGGMTYFSASVRSTSTQVNQPYTVWDTNYAYYGSGGGGGAGFRPSVTGTGFSISARGGAGGAGASSAYHGGGAGGAAGGTTTASGLSNFTASAGGWNDTQAQIVLSAPGISYAPAAFTANGVVTIN